MTVARPLTATHLSSARRPVSFTGMIPLPSRALLMAALAALACSDDDARSDAPAPPEPARAAEAPPSSETADRRRTILFLGNSLTAGFGVLQEQAFPALIQRKVDSAGLPYGVVNAGLSGETSAGGLRRIGWYLHEPVDVFVLELGANDMLRGHDLDATKRNLQAIIDTVRAMNPDVEVVIAGMRAPPNLGRDYVERFETMYRELARDNDAALIPFLLDGVAAEAALNLEDRIHPNPEGHRIVADNVWRVLEEVLSPEAGVPS